MDLPEDILEEPVSDTDAHGMRVFCRKLDPNTTGWHNGEWSPWFQKRYAIPLDRIRNACGREAPASVRNALWDAVVTSACRGRLDDYRIRPCERAVRCCALCNLTRDTRSVVDVAGVSYPIGNNCATLIQAVHEFYQTLCVVAILPDADMHANVDRLDRAMAVVQEMHANK
jgi:hypothetical protein